MNKPSNFFESAIISNFNKNNHTLILRFATLIIIFLLYFATACNNSQKPPIRNQTPVQSTNYGLCGGIIATIPDLDLFGTPKIMTEIGEAHLDISTKSQIAQQWFDQGLNLLHGFWHLEAWRAFREAAKADPNCAMVYWGIAMCQPGFGGAKDSRWVKAIQKSKALSATATKLEAGLIESTSILLQQGIAASIPIWKSLLAKYPEEPEVAAFTTIFLRQNVKTQEDSDAVKQLLETYLQKWPKHIGLQHYYVHVMEVRKDFLIAKEVAERMATQVANLSHIQHMPGHIYFLEGNYAKTVAVFEKARQWEETWHKTEEIPLAADQNYMHNLHYLAVAYSKLGKKEEALSIAKRYANITLRQEMPIEAGRLMLLYEGRMLPARVLIRFQDYAQAVKHIDFWLVSPDFPIQNTLVRLYLEVMRLYCLGMQAVQNGDFERSFECGARLSRLMGQYQDEAIKKKNSIEWGLINATFDIMSMARYELAGWLENMDGNLPLKTEAWDAAKALEITIPYQEPPRLLQSVSERLSLLNQFRANKSGINSIN